MPTRSPGERLRPGSAISPRLVYKKYWYLLMAERVRFELTRHKVPTRFRGERLQPDSAISPLFFYS